MYSDVTVLYGHIRARMRDFYRYNLPPWEALPHVAKVAYIATKDVVNAEAEVRRLREASKGCLTVTGDYGII